MDWNGAAMGQLFDAKQKIESAIAAKKLDAVQVKGAIGLRTGILLNLVNANTADDETKLTKLRAAAKEILGISV